MGRKAASGMGDFLDVKGCGAQVVYGKAVGQFLSLKDRGKAVMSLIHMDPGQTFTLS
jgi:hypothetical protein